MEVTKKELWDALREVACATKLKAHRIVMVHESDIEKAFELIKFRRKQADGNTTGTTQDNKISGANG